MEGKGWEGKWASALPVQEIARPNWNAAGSADVLFSPPKRPTDILTPPASDLQRPKISLLPHRSMERRRGREGARWRPDVEGNWTDRLLRQSDSLFVCLTVSALQSAADCS